MRNLTAHVSKKMKYHNSVLLNEVVQYLEPKSADVVLDATFGFGGHSLAISEKTKGKARIIGFEKDPRVFNMVAGQLPPNITLINDDFINYKKYLEKKKIGAVDKVIMDLGISSWHFDQSGLGFSFQGDEALDMRLNPDSSFSAKDILNSYSEADLADVFYYLADEYQAKRIAKAIVKARKLKKITRTSELVKIIESSKGERFGKIHPATKVFQALRIEVNKELSSLNFFLEHIIDDLNIGGRLAVISFHSKEDRIVKTIFKKYQKIGAARVLTKKPIVPGERELAINPRARSAKMRIILKGTR